MAFYRCCRYFIGHNLSSEEHEQISANTPEEASDLYANFDMVEAPDNDTVVVAVLCGDRWQFFDATYRTRTVITIRQITPEQADEPAFVRDSAYDADEEDEEDEEE